MVRGRGEGQKIIRARENIVKNHALVRPYESHKFPPQTYFKSKVLQIVYRISHSAYSRPEEYCMKDCSNDE